MTLKFSTSGRPLVECINPECRKLHAIYRRDDYINKPQVKVSCRSCGTKWNLNEDDKAKLIEHYQTRKSELELKKQKNQQKQSSKQNPIKKPTEQKPPVNNNDKQKKGWLDQLLS